MHSDYPSEVVELTRPRWRDMSQAEGGAPIEVQTELLPDIAPVMANETEIREALTNLVFNAVDAMPDGGNLMIRTSLRNRFFGSFILVVGVAKARVVGQRGRICLK